MNRHTVAEHKNEFERQLVVRKNGFALPDDTLSFYCRFSDGREISMHESYVKYKSFFDRTDSLLQLIDADYQRYKDELLQPAVDQLLTPYYMSQYEVSNNDYRKFVNWVRDSVAFRMLYDSLPPAEALKLLDITKEKLKKSPYKTEKAVDPANKRENLDVFRFNYHALDSKKSSFYDRDPYMHYLDSLYYPQNVRFYKRREVNISKLVYVSEATSPTPVYPDTLCWLRDSTYSYFDPLCNMYYWHPVFGNRPVVGLSEAQMKAYCDWLTRRMNESLADENYTVSVRLPELYHYEMAVKTCTNPVRRQTIDVFADAPFIIRRTAEESMEFMNRPGPVLIDPSKIQDELVRKHYEWERANQTTPVYSLTGGVSEYCFENDFDTMMTVLGGNRNLGLVDPHENQLNTVFYRQKIPVRGQSSTVGFRTIFYIIPKR